MDYVPLREKSIILIGFMGVGKTTIGKSVAKKLFRDFIDTDQEIEDAFQMPPTKIFQTYGEKAFRQKEKEIITNLCNQRLKIISVGGGAFLQEEIRQVCLSKCIVIYLDLSWEFWKERANILIESRPVLQGKNSEDMKKLFDERSPIYEEHHSKVVTDHLDVEEVSDFLVDSLKTAWDIYEPNH
nr:shikimate kinase [Aquibacillus sediminis]